MNRSPLLLVLAAGLSLAVAVLWLAGTAPLAASPLPQTAACAAATGDPVTYTLHLPLVAAQSQSTLIVDPQDRQASVDFFNQVYRASDGVAMGWTGSHAGCNAGSTSAEFREAVRLRINYFRAMAGVPAGVQLSPEYNAKAQQAALMMSVNGQLSHSPPASWRCYTADGAEAAGHSNLYLGTNGPPAISGYVRDPGSGNYFVGHRRWILYPQTQWMGTGDVPTAGDYWSANALWVFDDYMWGPRPPTRDEFVAWPPPGYVPYQVVFARWSFAYDDADFSSASVGMSTGGEAVPVAVQPVRNGYGENTLVWEPDVSCGSPPPADVVYSVAVRHVRIGGVLRDFAYTVVVFDPGPPPGAASAGAQWLGDPPRWPGAH